MPEAHSDKGLKTLQLMGTQPEDWTFAEIEWVKERRMVPTKVTCPTCHGRGRAKVRPDGSVAGDYPEPKPDYPRGADGEIDWDLRREQSSAYEERRKAWNKENHEEQCPTCPPRRNWHGYGTGEVEGEREMKVMVGYVKWPPGTQFDSRFAFQHRHFKTAVCELCSKTIKNIRMVPVVSHTDPPHGMWIGVDCARKFFDIKPLKKDQFLADTLESR